MFDKLWKWPTISLWGDFIPKQNTPENLKIDHLSWTVCKTQDQSQKTYFVVMFKNRIVSSIHRAMPMVIIRKEHIDV